MCQKFSLRVLLSIYLIFCQFQSGVAYKKKRVVVWLTLVKISVKNFCSKCKKFNLRKKSLEQIPFFEQCYRHPFIFMFCLVTPRAWCRGYIGKFWYCAAGDHDFLYVFICLCIKLYFFIKMFSRSGDWSKY